MALIGGIPRDSIGRRQETAAASGFVWNSVMALRATGLILALTPVLAAAPAAASEFDSCVSALRSTASSSGVSAAVFDGAMQGVRPDPEVLEKARRQPEFTQAIWDYLDSAVSDRRISDGLAMKRRYGPQLEAIERAFGVDRHVVLAVWGMESSYGQIFDNPKYAKPTIRSLATLACQGGRRSKFGRTQLLEALKIVQRGDVEPARMYGSWAGAMGHTQFIPTTYSAYAVDFTGDGRRDIWNSVEDALASTANYLREAGWRTGNTWGYEVRLPADFDYAAADDGIKRTIADWQNAGVARADGTAFPRPGDNAELVVPAGAAGPAFLMLRNHYVIRRYNNALAYALAVGHLADRLRGGDALTQAWPRTDRPLDVNQRKELQSFLNRYGFSTGGIDGKVGPKTKVAIRSYQRSAGLAADGYPSLRLLERLRAGG